MSYLQYEALSHFMPKKPTSSNSEKSQHGADAVGQRIQDAPRYEGILRGAKAWNSCCMEELEMNSIYLSCREGIASLQICPGLTTHCVVHKYQRANALKPCNPLPNHSSCWYSSGTKTVTGSSQTVFLILQVALLVICITE